MKDHAVPPPTPPNGRDRDTAGRFSAGNRAALTHGLTSDRLPAEFEHLRAEVESFLAASIADDGGDSEIATRRRALHEYRARLHRRILQLDNALDTRGMFDPKGKLREKWLQRLDSLIASARALDSLLGLDRRQRPVPSLAEVIGKRPGDGA